MIEFEMTEWHKSINYDHYYCYIIPNLTMKLRKICINYDPRDREKIVEEAIFKFTQELRQLSDELKTHFG